VASSCEYDDEPSSSGGRELVNPNNEDKYQ
jgi:hypothetical protein